MNAFASFRAAGPLAAALAFAALSHAYVGQWRSFTDQGRVTALAEHKGRVYAATYGGIRRIDPADLKETEFDNLDGLIDPWIVAFATDVDDALWAVSRSGYLYAARGARWDVWGRSYAAQDWKMNPRAAIAAGRYLYLGSEKGLSLFSIDAKVSQVNITRFRNELGLPVKSLLRREDTLYVGTSEGVFKARVYFAAPLDPPAGYANLADPSVWIHVPTPPVDTSIPDSLRPPSPRYDHLAIVGDTLATFGPGTLVQAPVRVEAFEGAPLVIGSATYDTATMDSTWKNDFSSALVAGGRIFVGGGSGLLVADGAAAVPAKRPAARAYPADSIFAIGSNNGNVWAQASSGLYFLQGLHSFLFYPSFAPVPSPELYYRSLRNVLVGPGGKVFVGTWGGGLVSDGVDFWKHQTDSCIYSFNPADPFSVAASVSNFSGKGFYYSVFKPAPGTDHQIVYFNFDTRRVSCPEGGEAVAGLYPHGMQVLSDTLLASASNVGVSFFRIRSAIQGPRLDPLGHWTLPGTANEAWDVAEDKWGRPWAVIGPNLAYVDSLETSPARKFKPIDNFAGQECKNLEADGDGRLWLGCANGLFAVTTQPDGSLASVRRYGLDDGLLSLRIFDVGVDRVRGTIWVATDRGVSMLEGPAQEAPPSGQLQSIVPYPNPMRAQHRFVLFDNLPRNSTLRIQDADGRIVRIFHPRDLQGSQAQWDGRNEQGKPVAPGVYLFSVVSGSSVARGKVIVAR